MRRCLLDLHAPYIHHSDFLFFFCAPYKYSYLLTYHEFPVTEIVHWPVGVVNFKHDGNLRQDAQLSQRDRAAGCVSFGQKWKTGTGRQYFMEIIGLSSTTVT